MINKKFDLDFEFYSKWYDDRCHLIPRDYLQDNERFKQIIEQWENYESTEGKYSWLVGHAYLALSKAVYRQGIIRNLEKYLTLKPFEQQIKNTLIPYYENDHLHIAKKRATTKEDLDIALKVHYQMIYYVLARAYQQENDIDNALRCVRFGMNEFPQEKFTFFFEFFKICKKGNCLPLYLEECNKLHPKEQKCLEKLIIQAKDLISRNYIFKPRKKEEQN